MCPCHRTLRDSRTALSPPSSLPRVSSSLLLSRERVRASDHPAVGIDCLELETLVVRWHWNRRLETGPGGARHGRQSTRAGADQYPPGRDLRGAVPARVHGGLAVRLASGARGHGERLAHPWLERLAVAQIGTGEARLQELLSRAAVLREVRF